MEGLVIIISFVVVHVVVVVVLVNIVELNRTTGSNFITLELSPIVKSHGFSEWVELCVSLCYLRIGSHVFVSFLRICCISHGYSPMVDPDSGRAQNPPSQSYGPRTFPV